MTITATGYTGGADPYTFTAWVAGTTQFNFSPGLADVGIYTLTVTIQDNNSVGAPAGIETVISSFTLSVIIVNSAPVWTEDPPQNLKMDLSQTYTYFLPSWSDVDSGDTHVVEVKLDNGADLPSFMSYYPDPESKIVLEPGLVEEVGIYVLKFSVEDDDSVGEGVVRRLEGTFSVTVTNLALCYEAYFEDVELDVGETIAMSLQG